MSNKELAQSLRNLSDLYDNDESLVQPSITIHTIEKEDLLKTIGQVGGKFTKRYADYFLYLASDRFPGLKICVSRDAVCRKIVTYECEPLLSQHEEAEIDAAALGQ